MHGQGWPYCIAWARRRSATRPERRVSVHVGACDVEWPGLDVQSSAENAPRHCQPRACAPPGRAMGPFPTQQRGHVELDCVSSSSARAAPSLPLGCPQGPFLNPDQMPPSPPSKKKKESEEIAPTRPPCTPLTESITRPMSSSSLRCAALVPSSWAASSASLAVKASSMAAWLPAWRAGQAAHAVSGGPAGSGLCQEGPRGRLRGAYKVGAACRLMPASRELVWE